MLSDARRAELVARLRGSPRAAPAPPRPDLLTPLAAGDGVPMMLCHPVSGTIHGYTALAQALAGDFQVYGIAAADYPATTDLPELAAGYADAVHNAHPGVPCVLGGWSIGGTVAFEVARRLVARGQRVDRLVFIDSPCRPWLPADVDPVLAFVTDAARSLGLPPRAGPDHPLDALARRLAGPAGNVAAIRQDLWRRYEVFMANWRMVDGYQPVGQLAADALIVCARDSPNRPMEWADLVKGTVRTLHVTGDHYTCLRPPWVLEIAAALKEDQ